MKYLITEEAVFNVIHDIQFNLDDLKSLIARLFDNLRQLEEENVKLKKSKTKQGV